MQVLINISAEEIKTLQNIKEIRDINDVVFCLHELIARATAKKPEVMVRDEDTKVAHITFKKGAKVYKCSACGELLTRICKCCPKCGQVVSWEG